MRGYLFPTDINWFTFLRERQPLDEVNFWRPSGRGFAALSPGEPLLFKLKSPHNAIGGFGLFARYEQATARLAWDAFGERNGATTFDEMCRRIEHYRAGQPNDPLRRYQVGCIMLSQPVFFADGDWVPQPTDWAPQAVSGASYDLASGEGLRVWQQCLDRAARVRPLQPVVMAAEPQSPVDAASGPRFGAPQIVLPRLGQGTFRVAVTSAYGRACAVTGEHSLPVLEAAHIRPYEDEGQHTVSNGLLLRADVHRLFDRGYVTVTPDLKFVVSPRLQEEFENGKVYYERHGKQIHLPSQKADHPDVNLLRWHNENVFESGKGRLTLRVDTVTAAGFGLLQAVRDTLASSNDSMLCVAFAHERGVRLLGKELEAAHRRGGKARLLVTTAFDRGGTTGDALTVARSFGVEVRTHNHSGGTFHPKLYLGSAGAAASAVIGSANLTAGLACNIEVGVALSGERREPALARAWEVGETLWNDARSEPWEVRAADAAGEEIVPELLAALSKATRLNPVFMTLGPKPLPNKVVEVTPSEIWIETERTSRERSGPQPVPAWMLNLAWEYLRTRGELANTTLLNQLRVHRSSAVCALLAKVPGVIVVPGRAITLQYALIGRAP